MPLQKTQKRLAATQDAASMRLAPLKSIHYKDLRSKLNYSDIVESSKNWPINYNFANFHVRCLKTQFSEHPWSIAECESEFLEEKIVERNCKRGLEIGTGTGISAIAAGFGFKRTGGNLITLDPFVEEHFGRCDLYNENNKEQSLNGVAQHLQVILDGLDLPVLSYIGYSPQDVDSSVYLLEPPKYPSCKLDYVLIDGRHETEAVKRDVDAVMPWLADKAIVFFHDIPCIQPLGLDYIEKKVGNLIRPERFFNPYGFNLGYVEYVRKPLEV